MIAALKKAASDSGQPKEVAQRLVAWLDDLATGSVDIASQSDAWTRIAGLLEQVKLPTDEAELALILGEE
ncbi:MAG TPA: hypothetical protein VIL09_18950 [Microvirga sp.]